MIVQISHVLFMITFLSCSQLGKEDSYLNKAFSKTVISSWPWAIDHLISMKSLEGLIINMSLNIKAVRALTLSPIVVFLGIYQSL